MTSGPVPDAVLVDARRDLVNIQLTYTAGVDNLDAVLDELDEIFPRWYARTWAEAGALGPSLTVGEAAASRSFEDTVRDYLKQELANHPPEDCDAVLLLAEELLRRQQTNGSWVNAAVEVREDDPLVATPLAVAALARCRRALAR